MILGVDCNGAFIGHNTGLSNGKFNHSISIKHLIFLPEGQEHIRIFVAMF